MPNKKVTQAEHEPIIRFAVTGMEGFLKQLATLPVNETADPYLATATGKIEDAITDLRVWARLTGLELHERMKT